MRHALIVSVLALALGIAYVSQANGLEYIAEEIAPMNVPHCGAGVATYQDKLYVWTGYTYPGDRTAVLEIYDPLTNTWTQAEDVPGARSSIGEFQLDGKLFSIGGEKSPSGSFTNTVYRYDIAIDNWGQINNFPTNIWDPQSIVCSGNGYVFGGRHGYGQTYSHVYEYDTVNDAWVAKTDMLYSVMQAGTVAYNDKIYVFGGTHKDNESHSEYVNKLQIYDVSTDSWSYGDDMPNIFWHRQTLLYENEAYLFADLIWDEDAEDWTQNNHIHIYSFENNTWRAVEFDSPTYRTLYNSPIGLIGDYAYFTETMDQGGVKLTNAYRIDLSNPIPEPGTLLLLAPALLGIAGVLRRKFRNR